MRISSVSAVLAFGLLAIGCGDKGSSAPPASSPATPGATTPPIVQNAVKPITDGLAATQAQVDAAKAEVVKYQTQVNDYQKQLGDLGGKKAAAEKALADINAEAAAKVAPLQKQLDDLNKQIKALESVKVGRVGKYRMVTAGFDVGGLIDKGSGTLTSLKTKADECQKTIDGILSKAKSAGLPYVDQIATYTDSIKTVTASLDKAQGLLGSAQQNLSSLTGAK